MANVPVVRVDEKGQREALLMRWWLVPFWAKAAKPEYSMFNARSEDAETKPSFRGWLKQLSKGISGHGRFSLAKNGSPVQALMA